MWAENSYLLFRWSNSWQYLFFLFFQSLLAVGEVLTSLPPPYFILIFIPTTDGIFRKSEMKQNCSQKSQRERQLLSHQSDLSTIKSVSSHLSVTNNIMLYLTKTDYFKIFKLYMFNWHINQTYHRYLYIGDISPIFFKSFLVERFNSCQRPLLLRVEIYMFTKMQFRLTYFTHWFTHWYDRFISRMVLPVYKTINERHVVNS